MKYVLLVIVIAGCTEAPDSDRCDGVIPVTVRNAAGDRVFAHARSGALAGEATLDAAGEATLAVPRCGGVTIAYEQRFLATILGVEDGDVIDLRRPVVSNDMRPLTFVFDPHPNASHYIANFGAAIVPVESGVPVEVPIWTLSATGTLGFVLEAHAFEGGIDAYAVIPETVIASDGSTQITAPAWRTDTVAWVPPVVPDGGLSSGGRLEPTVGTRWTQSAGERVIPGGAALAEVEAAAIESLPSGQFVAHARRLWTATAASSSGLVVSTAELPPIPPPPVFDGDAARPTVSWPIESNLASTVLIVSAFYARREWNLMLAPTETIELVRFPELPAEVAPAEAPSSTQIIRERGSMLGSYADVRRFPRRTATPTAYVPVAADLVFEASGYGISLYPTF